ncbi:thiolase-like protein [Aspergillus californicus]
MAFPMSPAQVTRNGSDVVEPIAIIGMSCRYSGTADTPDGLWQMLCEGTTSWSKSAHNRFKLDSFWNPKGELSGSVGFLVHDGCKSRTRQDPAAFDNDFFGINGVEAKAINPRQRLMLEVAYETFENAGIPLEELEGSQTGVYCALSYLDYDQILGRDPEVSPSYRYTGTGGSMLANRISYVFDLRGPSMTIDTSCSSTLVAVHDACRAIRLGEVEQVLVGGVNLILDPDKLTVQSSMQFLSPDGRCYSFDSRADGYGRGEGLAGVLLKSLSSAMRDGDPVRAVIRGTSVVCDGKTPGITMPCWESQAAAIRRAYESAGLNPSETLYVEAHGTGTKAGDRAEAMAFSNTFCKCRRGKANFLVGGIKSNVGHIENASGLAAIVKTVLLLENGIIRQTQPLPSQVKSCHWKNGVQVDICLCVDPSS